VFDSNLTVSKNAVVGGTLNVTGVTTLGTLSAGASTLSSLNVTGTATTGWLDVLGSTILHKDLTVRGSTTFVGAVSLGAVSVTSILDSGKLDVFGATTAHDSLSVTGSTRLAGNATLMGTLAVTGATDIFGATTVHNTLTVTGSASIKQGLDVTLGTTLNNTLQVQRTDGTKEFRVDTLGNLFAKGRLMIGGDMTTTNTLRLTDFKVTGSIPKAPAVSAPILTFTFKDFRGTGVQIRKGAFIRLNLQMAGASGATAAEYIALADGYIDPGTTAAGAVTYSSISSNTTNLGAAPNIVVVPGAHGSGKQAVLTFNYTGGPATITNQNNIIFYEIFSDNLAGVV